MGVGGTGVGWGKGDTCADSGEEIVTPFYRRA